jgi:predicted nucleic acid-binding protein
VIIADTGFWLALANRNDRHHQRAVAALDCLNEELITTWPVLTETTHLLAARLSVQAELHFMRSALRGAFRIFSLDESHLPRATELMEQYCDLPMDLADASLVILAETLGSGRILSTDERDLQSYRFKTRSPFENLLYSAPQID